MRSTGYHTACRNNDTETNQRESCRPTPFCHFFPPAPRLTTTILPRLPSHRAQHNGSPAPFRISAVHKGEPEGPGDARVLPTRGAERQSLDEMLSSDTLKWSGNAIWLTGSADGGGLGWGGGEARKKKKKKVFKIGHFPPNPTAAPHKTVFTP